MFYSILIEEVFEYLNPVPDKDIFFYANNYNAEFHARYY